MTVLLSYSCHIVLPKMLLNSKSLEYIDTLSIDKQVVSASEKREQHEL
jgi:hypothetical protein